MSARTLVLCASVGTLLLSAAPNPASESRVHQAPSLERRTQEIPSTERQAHASDRPAACPWEEATSAELLRAAYGPVPSRSPSRLLPPVEVEEPTLWLARAVYSETKLPHEQELVAWVVRNRVETNYRGESTYREVVLDPYQFSAFNPDSPKRPVLMGLTPSTRRAGWQQALWVAYYVRHADPVYRPFPIETRHFYSERSMQEQRAPYWADGSQFVFPGWNYLIEKRRFRFFEQIS